MDQAAARRLLQGAGVTSGNRRGLGFRVVRELVAISNGSLNIESQPEVGTTISAEWYAVKQEEVEVQGEELRMNDSGVAEVVEGRRGVDGMLRMMGTGAQNAGGGQVLSEGLNVVNEAAGDSPSGVLIGVSPVGASAEGAQKIGLAEHLSLLHVLVVDDDDAVRKACCQIASGMGFEVVGAESATTARAILKERRIDLLLLDLKLPGGGGLALLEQVKTLHPDTAVIVMTAFATVSSAVEAMRIGAGGLSDQAVCVGGVDCCAGAHGTAAAYGCAEQAVAGAVENAAGDGRAGGAVAGDGEAVSDSFEGGVFDASGFDSGREWNG